MRTLRTARRMTLLVAPRGARPSAARHRAARSSGHHHRARSGRGAVRRVDRPSRTDPPRDQLTGVRDEDEVAAHLEAGRRRPRSGTRRLGVGSARGAPAPTYAPNRIRRFHSSSAAAMILASRPIPHATTNIAGPVRAFAGAGGGPQRARPRSRTRVPPARDRRDRRSDATDAEGSRRGRSPSHPARSASGVSRPDEGLGRLRARCHHRRRPRRSARRSTRPGRTVPLLRGLPASTLGCSRPSATMTAPGPPSAITRCLWAELAQPGGARVDDDERGPLARRVDGSPKRCYRTGRRRRQVSAIRLDCAPPTTPQVRWDPKTRTRPPRTARPSRPRPGLPSLSASGTAPSDLPHPSSSVRLRGRQTLRRRALRGASGRKELHC